MLYRAVATAVDATGVYLEVPSILPGETLGPCQTTVEASPGDLLVVADLGSASDTDIVVVGVVQ